METCPSKRNHLHVPLGYAFNKVGAKPVAIVGRALLLSSSLSNNCEVEKAISLTALQRKLHHAESVHWFIQLSNTYSD